MKMKILCLVALLGGALARPIALRLNNSTVPAAAPEQLPCPGSEKPLCNHGTYRIRPVSYIGRALYPLQSQQEMVFVASLCGKQNYRGFQATVSINLPKNVDWDQNGGAPDAIVAYDSAFTRPVCYISATDDTHQRRCTFTYPGVSQMPYVWIRVKAMHISGTLFSVALYFNQAGELALPEVHPDNPEWRKQDIEYHMQAERELVAGTRKDPTPMCPPEGAPKDAVCLEQIVEAGNGAAYENQDVCNEKLDCYVVDLCKNSDIGKNWEVYASVSGFTAASGFQSWLCDPLTVFDTTNTMGCGAAANQGKKPMIWDEDVRASAYNSLMAESKDPNIGDRLETFVVAVEGFGGNQDQSNKYGLGLSFVNLPG